MSAATGPLQVARDGAVATVTIDRPERRNAISLDVYRTLPGLLASLDDDAAVRVVVMRGAGQEAFAAGADISEFPETRSDGRRARAYNEHVLAAERALEGVAKPTIAMVHGYCIGGGANLALACDLRFADDRARFGVPSTRLGLVVGFEATRRLVTLVGPARAKWVLMPGDPIDAHRAHAIGLFEAVVPPEELADLTYAFAARLAERAQYSVRAVKQMVACAAAGQQEEDDAMRELREASFDTADYAEGVRAFLEKRPPAFT